MKAAILLRGVVSSRGYQHHSGRIYDIDARNNLQNIVQTCIEPLKRSFDGVDVFMASYASDAEGEAAIRDVQSQLRTALGSGGRVFEDVYYPVSMNPSDAGRPLLPGECTQTALILDGIRAIPEDVYDALYIVRFDIQWKVPITTIFTPAPGRDDKIVFLFHEKIPQGNPLATALVSDVFFGIPGSRLRLFKDVLASTSNKNSLHTFMYDLENVLSKQSSDKQNNNQNNKNILDAHQIAATDFARPHLPHPTRYDSNTDNEENPLYLILRYEARGWWKNPIAPSAKAHVAKVWI